MKNIPLDQLTEKCRQENNRLAQTQTGACWELFRRALMENDQPAWLALHSQYRRLIGKWAAGAALDLDDLTAQTFARFWEGIRRHDFSERFANISSVMGYLKRTARSLAIDKARQDDRRQKIADSMAADTPSIQPSPQELAEEKIFSQELRTYLSSRLSNADEQLVFFLSFEIGLKPREIAQKHPDHFPTPKDVSRLKERIVSRLANDPILQDSWR